MPSIAALVKFKAKDQVSRKFDKMARRAAAMEKRTSKAFAKASRSASTFGGTLGGVLGANLISRGTDLLAQGLGEVTREWVEFDQALTSASAKFPEKIQRGTKEFERLGAAARKVGAETQFTATEAGQGLEFLAMAGFNATEAMSALPVVVDLATAANMDLARATDIASDAVGAFGPVLSEYETVGGKISHINDVMAATVTSANVDMEDFFETMKDGAPVASSAGASIETFSALLGTMGSAGIKGSKAGTVLKNMFLRLQAPVPKAAKMLKKLGIEVSDNEGNMKDMITLLGEFERKTKKMGNTQKAATLDTIFGKRAIAGVNVLLDVGADKLRAYEQTLKDSTGAAEEMADNMRKGLGNQIKALQSSAVELGFRFLEAFTQEGEGGIKDLTEAIRRFDVKPIVEGTREFIDTAKTMAKWVKENWSLIKGITTAILGYKGTLIVVGAATKAYFAILSANPLGAVAAAIGLVTAAVVTLNEELDQSIARQEKMQAADIQLKSIKAQSRLYDDLKQTKKDDMDSQISLRKQMVVQLQKEKRMQELIGESTDETTSKIESMKIMIDALSASQNAMGIFTGQIFSGREGMQPSIFTGESPVERQAPNAAEVDAKGGRSTVDVNFNNAPAGTTTKTKQGRNAPQVRTQLAGANP